MTRGTRSRNSALLQQLFNPGAEFQESLGKLRIELSSRNPFDPVEGLGGSHAGAVGAIAGHGVEGVGHGDDAGQPRDLRAPQLIGIAVAVPAFVVIAGNRDGFLEIGNGL